MILHTIVSHETIFEETHEPQVLEIERGQMRLLVSPLDRGRAQIVRVISSDPNDFLRTEYQPGQAIDLVSSDLANPPYEGEQEL